MNSNLESNTKLPQSTSESEFLVVGKVTSEWWRHAVIYQIYPRSFKDSNGDGVGDLRGVIEKLDYLEGLGIDAIWLSPFYPSPQKDAGYDVSDFCGVDPLFGTLDDFQALLKQAHQKGLKIIVDIVPNHSSDQHPWFRDAISKGPGSRERDRYIFRPGKGNLPPNNWQSDFAGPAWTHLAGDPDQWYLHLFDSTQPDFNWKNNDVVALFDEVLRYWLDLGVDGFRVDVASGLVKEEGLPDYPVEFQHGGGYAPDRTRSPLWDNEGVHEIYRRWRSILDEYVGDRMLVAEAYVEPISRLARYVRPDEMHQAFNFPYLKAVSANEIAQVITDSLQAYGSIGAPSTWVLNNHDNVRHASRLGLTNPYIRTGAGIGPLDPQPDRAVGLQRARALTAIMLALPGSAYIYQGEELGLPEHTTLGGGYRQDPTWQRSGGTIVGRDGARIPLPWRSDEPAFGFSPTGRSWLPQPDDWGNFCVDRQSVAEDSTLGFYRTAIEVRKGHRIGESKLSDLSSEADVLRFRVGGIEVLANLSEVSVHPPLGHVLVASGPIDRTEVPPHTTVWSIATESVECSV